MKQLGWIRWVLLGLVAAWVAGCSVSRSLEASWVQCIDASNGTDTAVEACDAAFGVHDYRTVRR
jgi:hypothetical protein